MPLPSRSSPATAGLRRRGLMMLGVAGVATVGLPPLWNAAVAVAGEAAVVIPPPTDDIAAATAPATDTAVFAGGCFWGVQGVFQHVKGVSNAVSGYAGGEAKTAKYDMIGSGRTGHAEAVRITFDPKQVSYGQLLQIFFSVVHDPTQLNRQGPDSGTQYRSAIFPANAEQMRVANSYIAQLDKAKVFPSKIATTIEPMKPFYAAEAYHQDYLKRNPSQPYIVFNDLPKIENFKRVFADRYREKAALVGANS